RPPASLSPQQPSPAIGVVQPGTGNPSGQLHRWRFFDMRIAQVAPLAESCPPRLYGGTERVVHVLTEELVKLGHEVTLFASGDSRTSARLVPCVPEALR